MRILFFVGAMNAGGAERVAATLVNAWAAQGHQVMFVATHLQARQSFYPIDRAVHTHWLGKHLPRLPLPRIVRKWWAIRKLVKQQRPDVVVSFLTNVNVTVLACTCGLKVPVIVSERTNPLHSQSAGAALKRLRRWLYPYAQAVVAQTEDSRQALQRLIPRLRPTQLAVLPNPLPDAVLEVTRSQPVTHTVAPHVVALGRLASPKGFDQLIRVFAMVAASRPEWSLHIYGDGPLKGSLQQQVDQTGLATRIHLKGRTDQPWQALGKAQVFALSSLYEGFPNVLLEAMAMGLPCVTVDCPSGPRDMSDQGRYARLVPSKDDEAFAQALAELMDDAALRGALGQRAAQWVVQRYRSEAVVAQWDALLNQVSLVQPQP